MGTNEQNFGHEGRERGTLVEGHSWGNEVDDQVHLLIVRLEKLYEFPCCF